MSAIQAVFFDIDGVIIDTERDGHRVSFNLTFKEFGFTDKWSIEYYHELLQVAGGKERMMHHWKTQGFSRPVSEAEVDELVKAMHKRKTAIFVDLIESLGKAAPAGGSSSLHERGHADRSEDRCLHNVE